MKLTLTFMNHNEQKDIQVNPRQKLEATMQILREAGLFEEPCRRIKSVRRGVYLDKACTYEELHILTGDVIRLEQ